MKQCRTAYGDGSTELSHTHRHDLLFLCFEMRPLPGTPTARLHVTPVYCLTLRVAPFYSIAGQRLYTNILTSPGSLLKEFAHGVQHCVYDGVNGRGLATHHHYRHGDTLG